MTNPWLNIPVGPKAPVYCVKGAIPEEPKSAYSEAYLIPADKLNPLEKQDIQRWIDEVLCDFSPGCSVLVFGSGHSYHCNTFFSECGNIEEMAALDFVPEASVGLNEEIKFYCLDILKDDIIEKYDYVFTTHTIEHFTKDNIFNIVMPKLFKAAKKAVVALVPYGDNWSSANNHQCRFYENDEFAAMATRYKRIRDNPDEGKVGIEIVFWFDVEEHQNSA